MNIIELPIVELSPDPANLRNHSEGQITKLIAALRRWGQTLPLLIDGNNVVRVGNARLQAMERLGWTSVRVIRLDLSPSEWVALAIADNKLHDDSEFDHDALANTIAALREEGSDLLAIGFDAEELAKLFPADAGQDGPTAPEDFESFDDETIETEHCCPKCKFRWSGSSSSSEAA